MTSLSDLGICMSDCGRRLESVEIAHTPRHPMHMMYEDPYSRSNTNNSRGSMRKMQHEMRCTCMAEQREMMRMLVMLVALDTVLLLYLAMR
jgi:hypothetical protein